MKPLASILVGLLMASLLLSFGITHQIPKGRIVGQVVLSENGRALPRARVVLLPANVNKEYLDESDLERMTQKTDAQGRFSFSDLPAGQYQLSVSGTSHKSLETILSVTEGEPVTTKLKMMPEEPSLNAYFSQQVWLPSEKPQLELSGFITRDSLRYQIYKITDTELVKAGSTQALLQTWVGGRSGPKLKDKNPVKNVVYKPQNKDVEGSFVDKISFDSLAEGLYYVRFSADPLIVNGYLNVTKIGMVLRSDDVHTVVYVADLSSGKPVAGAKIMSVSQGMSKPLGVTSELGMLNLSENHATDRGTSYMAYAGNSIALCSSFGSKASKPGKIALVTDRPVYRPGDRIQFKGIVRNLIQSQYAVPADGPAKINIKDPNGNLLETKTFPMTQGMFSGDWTGNPELPPGNYDFQIQAAGQEEHRSVELAAYRKPEFNVEVLPQSEAFYLGDNAAVKVRATYFYGAPVVGASIRATVYRSATWSISGPDADEDDSSDDALAGDYVQDLEAQTDEKGQAILQFKLAATDPKITRDLGGDFRYSVSAYVSDSTKRGTSGTGSFTARQGELTLELLPKRWFAEVGQTIECTLKARPSGNESLSLAGHTISVSSSRERYRANELVQEPYQDASAVTDNDGNATVSMTLAKRGSYRLTAKTVDSKGRTIQTTTYVLATEPGLADPEDVPSQTPLSVSLDKQSYQVGDNLKALIQGGKPGSGALVCVDGGGILETRLVTMNGNSATVVLPVSGAMAPNARLSVFSIADKNFLTASRDIKLDWSDHNLKVELSSDRPDYKPGELATVRIRTTDAKNRPVAASLSVGVVDESIYAIRQDRLKIQRTFYPKRISTVRTSYSFAEIYLDGGDKSPAKQKVRKRFQDTAYWNPNVSTDAQGEASVSVPLPDNLTSWRVTAVGITAATDVGQQTLRFPVKRPLMVRLDVPQFLVVGDRHQVTANVSNESLANQEIKVQLDATGLVVKGSPGKAKLLEAGKQISFSWEVVALPGPGAKVTATVTSDRDGDAEQKSFPILPNVSPTYEHQSGLIGPDTAVTVNLEPGAQREVGGLTVQVSPGISAAAADSLNGLVGYPYGCVEQTLSRFVPSLLLYQLAQKGAVPKTEILQQTPQIVGEGLTRLARMQHSDGSWGWWEYDEPSGLMTAFALEGIGKARAAGYKPTGIQLELALDWAEQQLNKEIDSSLKPYEKLALGVQLAGYGRKKQARKAFRSFDKQLAGPAEWSLAARLYARLGDKEGTAQALQRLEDKAVVEGGLAHWLGQGWTDGDANTGMAMIALAEAAPKSPLLAKAIQYVMLNQSTGGWSSTFSTGQIVEALASQLDKASLSAQGSVEVVVNGKSLQVVPLGNGPAVNVALPTAQLVEGPNQVQLRKTGGGDAYYSVMLKQFGAEPPLKKSASGLEIQRSYHIIRPGRVNNEWQLIPNASPDQEAQSGEVLECQIVIKSSEPHQFVIIEDPFPSNCVVTERDQLEDGETWSQWYSGMVIKDDRVAFFARKLPAGEKKLVYHLRAQIPGQVLAPPTVAFPMYSPEISQRSEPSTFKVRP